jgi:hypothetical protein
MLNWLETKLKDQPASAGAQPAHSPRSEHPENVQNLGLPNRTAICEIISIILINSNSFYKSTTIKCPPLWDGVVLLYK